MIKLESNTLKNYYGEKPNDYDVKFIHYSLDVEDGEYEGQTYTSFLHLKLKVTVENHQLKNIEVLENDGLDGETAKPIIEEMIKQNKIVVPAIKGAELGSLVYISCVSTALSL